MACVEEGERGGERLACSEDRDACERVYQRVGVKEYSRVGTVKVATLTFAVYNKVKKGRSNPMKYPYKTQS